MLRTILTLLFCLAAAAPAVAKEYRATRYDSRIDVERGGHLRITETVVFTFEEGTFREVFRTIPTRRTDGVEFVSASIDGVRLPPGTAPGQVEVRRRNGLRVTWHFPPTSGTTHTFELSYIARGVVRQEDGRELLAWMALPAEHGYRVDASRVEIVLPAEPIAEPVVTENRVDGGLTVNRTGASVVVLASDIRRNGRFTVSAVMPRGTVLDGPPAWQARQMAHRDKLPLWLSVAGVTLALGLMLLFALRQSGDHPKKERGVEWTSLIPPDPLSPALAGALVANGQPQLQHAMATVFALAERGIVSIREEPRGVFGQRNFVIQRTRAGEHLAPHEETMLDIIFSKASGAEASVPIARARSYVMRHFGRFKKAVAADLADAGLLDSGRMAHRRRYGITGVVLLALAGIVAAGCLLLIDRYGGYPLLIPLALALAALASFIFMAAHTPLSNDGVRRAEQWRGYRKHLTDPQGIASRWGASGPAEARILPYAVALGLAAAWAKFMKKGKVEAPAWFHAAAQGDGGPAFAAFIATGGAGATGGGTPGAGGVAGGGASGAR